MSQITSKWRRDYILLVHSSTYGTVEDKKEYEKIARDSALQYARLKLIPNDRMFATVLKATGMSYKFLFNPLADGSLSELNEMDKLFIFAHASTAKVGDLSAKSLARKLKSAGMRKAGLITFKACDVGKGNFLEDFVSELRERSIHIGFAKGYLEGSETIEKWPGPTLFEEITTDSGKELEGSARYRVVPGHYSSSTVIAKMPKKTVDRYLSFLSARL